MEELETKEVDLTLAKEQETNKPSEDKVVKQPKYKTQKELAAERKFIRQQKKIIKEEVEDMELEFKYISYKMNLPSMRQEFQKWMNETHPKPVKKSVDEAPLPDNVVKMDTGTPIVKTE